MFSHVMLGARDLEVMVAFYDTVLSRLDLCREPGSTLEGIAGVIWKQGDQRWPQFCLRIPINGLPATWGNGVQVSFCARSRQDVDAAWRAAIQAGGQDEGHPAIRTQYAEDFYAAYCRDPEGNKLCFVHAPDLP